MRISQTGGTCTLLESVKPRGPTGSRSCSLRLRSPQPRRAARALEPAPSLVGAAVVAARLRQRRRLSRRLLLRPPHRTPAEPVGVKEAGTSRIFPHSQPNAYFNSK